MSIKFKLSLLALLLLLESNFAIANEQGIKVALALGGGGTRGAAHVGVLRVLKEEGIPVDAVVGTSMGALVGGLYCAGMQLDDIEDLFYEKKMSSAFYTVPIPVRVALIPIFFVAHLFGYHPYDGLYRGNKFAHYLANRVPEDKREIEKYQPAFWAVSTNLLDGQPYAIKKGNIGRAIQASAAIPALRRPVEIEDQLLVDGGIVENLPTAQALKMGCDYIIAVDVDELLSPVPAKTFRAIGSVSRRALNITLSRIDQSEIKMANIVIQPDLHGINLLSTKKEDAYKAVVAGEEATRLAIPQIKQQLAQLAQNRSK